MSPTIDATDLRTHAREHIALAETVANDLLPTIEEIADRIRASLAAGGRLLVCGNGGSAADAQHFAAELLGRARRERRSLPAIALTTDTSALTGIGNDYAFEDIFSRQVAAHAGDRDVVLGISTSGASENVARALRAARERGACAIALTGGDGGPVAGTADVALVIPSRVTARIQEMHILAIHLICERIDDWAVS